MNTVCWRRGDQGMGGGNLRKHVVYDTLIIFYKDEHDQVSFYVINWSITKLPSYLESYDIAN